MLYWGFENVAKKKMVRVTGFEPAMTKAHPFIKDSEPQSP